MHRFLRRMILILAIIIIALGIVELLFNNIFKADDREGLVSDTGDIYEPDTSDIPDILDEPEVVEKIYKYTKDYLNLRAGPSINEDVLLVIPKGDRVEFIEQEDGWDKIIYDNTTGYSSSEYLTEPEIEEVIDGSSGKDDEMEIVVSPETMKTVKGILLVNKEYALSMDYDPGEDPEAREYLDKMFEVCYEETGKNLIAYSGYRTYEYQKNLFNRYVEKDGYEKAVMYSARPRHSEHETGLAFDIGGSNQAYWLKESFEDTEEGIWLRENAHRFGFILRYPKEKTDITGYIYEPWHFRYIGIDHASNIYELDVTLEEYLLD